MPFGWILARRRRTAPAALAAQLLSLALLLALLPPALPARADPVQSDPSAANQRERFFGAVQAIFNPGRAAEAGVQWERLIFPWSLIQKNGPDSWDKGYFTDDQVAQERARGLDVVGVALYTPQWATSTPKNAKPTNVPANLYLAYDDPRNYWGQFMYKLATRYRGQINTWIVWNEPDMYSDQIQYTWDGSVEDFYQLLKVAYLAVKKANPDARVALPGLTYWWDKEGGRTPYLARLLEVAGRDPGAPGHNQYFDIVTLHQYTNPLNAYAAVKAFQHVLAIYGQQRPIWIGEANVVPYDDPRAPTNQPFHATMDQQAAFVLQSFALARAAGAERMSIYKLVDEQAENLGELYGLVRNDGSPRPAFQAYQTAVRYLSGAKSAYYTWDRAAEQPTPEQVTQLLDNNAHSPQWLWPAATNRVVVERADGRVSVVWNASPKATTARIPAVARSAVVVDKLGNVTGEVVAQNGQYSLELPPSTNHTDPRDPNLYLVGGDPRILVERVTPLPDVVDAPIQVVWPRDGAPVDQASQANLSGVLLVSGTTTAVPCRWNPTVKLLAAVDGGTPRVVATGTWRLVTDDGVTYAVWDFNNVDVSPAQAGHGLAFWLDVDGVQTRAWRWSYGQGIDQPDFWQQRPTVSCG